MPADPKRVETLFNAVLAIPTLDRAAFLAAECGDDAELRQRIERLLAAHAELGSIPNPTEAHTPEPDTDAHTRKRDEAGTLIAGKYKLVEEVGEGGMGTVWMAQQTEPVKRMVAVKLIKAGMDSKAVLARFEAERQALALMDHPNIARVLDAGATPDGRPFFVMELVKGVPITKYCDERRLTPKQRLELFVPVCQAIQHAHQKGIIHRDIKPSNVLVAMYDDRAVPKVIDFGVAKAAGQQLTEKTLATGFGAVVGTPEYMSPEQASFNNLDIDTRSDVYALGVLLYELLAGSPPFSKKEMEKVGLLEIFRVIREQEPPKPSTKLSTADALPSLAASRGTDPAKLARLLRGELDWVVMKALEKDRTRRYETANGFAMDVQRYLAGEPVQAVPPSAGYRLRKLLRRNKGPVLVGASIAGLLVLGSVISTWQAVRAIEAEHLAAERREAAEKAEAQAKDERDEADRQKRRAEENEDKARHSLYVANMNRVRFELEQNNLTQAVALLDLYRHPQNPTKDPRGWEWYYWDRACQGALYTLTPDNTSGVSALAFSRDGALLATSDSRAIKFWDTVTGEERNLRHAPAGGATWLAYTPDGHVLISRTGRGVKLWDALTGAELHSLMPEGKDVFGPVALSPDGTVLAVDVAAGTATSIQFWDIKERKWMHRLPHQNTRAFLLRYSSDGNKLAQGHAEGATIWDLERRVPLHTVRGHLANEIGEAVTTREHLTGLAFSPDGRTLATCGKDGTARLHDVRTGREIRAFTVMPGVVHSGQGVTDVTFTPSGTHLIASAEHGSLKSWSVATGREDRSFLGHSSVVSRIAITADGTRLASVSGTAVKVWDAIEGPIQCLSAGRLMWTQQPAFTADGKLLGLSINHEDYFGQVEVRAVDEIRPARLFVQPKPGKVTSKAFSPDGKMLATAFSPQKENPRTPVTSHEIHLWDIESGRVLQSFRGLASPAYHLDFSPDGQSFAFALLRTAGSKLHAEIKIWDVSGKELHSFPGASKLVFAPDGRTMGLHGGDKPGLKLLDRGSGRELRSLEGQGTTGVSVFAGAAAFSRDGTKLYFRGAVWETATGRRIYSLSDAAPTAGFSPDGSRLFTMTSLPGSVQGHLRVWDAATGDLLLAARVPGTALAVHPDGWRCAVSSDHAAAWILDARPLTPQLRQEHEARNLVAHLFRRPMLRDEVIAFVRGLKTISEPVRRQALALAQVQEHDADRLLYAASDIAVGSDSTPEEYRKALPWAEEALRLDATSGGYANTVGTLLYYLGRYAEAETMLKRAFELNMKRPWETISAYDLLHLAMAQYKQGRHDEARATLKRARDPDPNLNAHAVLPRHWREAEALIEGKKHDLTKTPGGPANQPDIAPPPREARR